MLIRQSFDDRFVVKLNELKEKYGLEMFELDGIGPSKLDINNFAKKFFKTNVVADVSVDGNANVEDNSILSLEYEFSKALQKLNGYYIIWKKATENPKYGIKRANKLIELCINGTLKFHDLQFALKPYCYAFSLAPLIEKGMPFIKKVKIGPPRHFKSFINLVIQLTAYASNQMAGATAFPDLFIYMDWYARKDFGENYLDNEENKRIIEQELQSLIYSWNFPFRGSQSSFTNVNMYDKFFLKDLFEGFIYPDMTNPNLESVAKLQEFYMKWIVEESKKQVFTFPVNTVTLYKDDTNEIPDKNFLNTISELNCYNGIFNIYTGPLGSLASCCRLRNNTNQVKEYYNSFGVGVSIGSHRVVTINLPHLAHESEDNNDFMKNLDYTTRAAQDILDIHRDIIVDNINRGKLPLYTHGFMHLERQFSTIGFIGINEACEILGYDILNTTGSKLATDMLNKMNDLNAARTKEDGRLRNIEQVPGESAAVMFAKKDKLLFTDQKHVMYGNQYIPLWKNVNVEDRIKAQGLFDSMCGGGAICHINLTDSIEPNQMQKLIEHSAKKGVIYFAVNMNNARCDTCGKIYIGKFDKSPCHNATMTNFLRVVGFLTPVTCWIPERREEYKLRQFYGKTQI